MISPEYLTRLWNEKIVLNPPQFIFIPAEKREKGFADWARDTALIDKS